MVELTGRRPQRRGVEGLMVLACVEIDCDELMADWETAVAGQQRFKGASARREKQSGKSGAKP
jgi:hypothetical protein